VTVLPSEALTFSCALKSAIRLPRRMNPVAPPTTWNACSQSSSLAHVPLMSSPSKCQFAPETTKPSSVDRSSFAPRGVAERTTMAASAVPFAEQAMLLPEIA